jgi:hypothetical protein
MVQTGTVGIHCPLISLFCHFLKGKKKTFWAQNDYYVDDMGCYSCYFEDYVQQYSRRYLECLNLTTHCRRTLCSRSRLVISVKRFFCYTPFKINQSFLMLFHMPWNCHWWGSLNLGILFATVHACLYRRAYIDWGSFFHADFRDQDMT